MQDKVAKFNISIFLFYFIIIFPFIPQIVSSSDTQPLLLIYFGLYLIFIPFWNSEKFKLNRKSLAFFVLIIVLFFLQFLNYFISGKAPIISRYVAFIQLLVAIYFGNFLYFEFNNKWFKYSLIIYFILTIVYFSTNGFIENILVQSRDASSEDLMIMGRGARTMSPEPSFFALHLFNLYVINELLRFKNYGKKDLIENVLLFILLFSSLSGYGILIFFFILSIEYPKFVITSTLILFSFFTFFYERLISYENFRSIDLILRVISDGPISLLENDASISSRMDSFVTYYTSIKDNIFLGDNFSVLEGGGFIGLISGLGLIGFLYLIIINLKILGFISSPKLVLILIFWFLLNLISGPFGIPTIGLIVGLILRNSKLKFKI